MPQPTHQTTAVTFLPDQRQWLSLVFASLCGFALWWIYPNKKSAPTSSQAAITYTELSEPQLEALAKKIVSAYQTNQPREALSTLDLEHILPTAHTLLSEEKKPLPPAAKKTLSRRLESHPHDLWPMPPKSQARWQGWRDTSIGRVGLIRVLYDDGSFSYYGLDPRRGTKLGRLADYYSFTSGQWLTESLALLATTLGDISPTRGWSQFFSSQAALTPEEKKSIRQCLETQTWAAFDATYQQLPPSVQKSRWLVRRRLQMARSAPLPVAQRVMEESRTLFPDDPAHDFFSIDLTFAAGDFSQMQQLLTRCEEKLGGDAYLRSLRAYTALRQADLPLAEKLDQEALALEPDLLPVWQVHIKVLSRQPELTAALAACEEAARRFGPTGVMYFPDDPDEGLRRLASYPPYAQWREAQAK